VQEISNLPELVQVFSAVVVERTSSICVLCVPEIITNESLMNEVTY
jgi:hypothetical protein